MITYLTQHKTIAILLLIAYFLGLVYFHDAATVVADWLKYKLTLRYYNLSLLLSGLALSLVTGYFLWRKILKHPERRMFFRWFLITNLAMILALFTMMVVNMEAIHYPQYAFLAILVFPVVRRYEDAFIMTTILGMVDEIYQYLILNPAFKYFDFNDISLNMLGAGAGLLIIAAYYLPVSNFPNKWYYSSSFYFLCLLISLGIIFSWNFAVSFFPVTESHEGYHWFSLYRENLTNQFWTHIYSNRYYHILRPWEGIVLMSVLTIFYAQIDYFYAKALTFKSIT